MTNNVSVMFFYHYADMNNGAVRSMTDVIDVLVQKYNIKATVIYPCEKGSAIEHLERIGVNCYRVNYGRLDYKASEKFNKVVVAKAKLFVKYAFKEAHIKKLEEIIDTEKVNILYTNTIVLYIGALLSKRTNLPLIWHIREFGKEDHGYSFLFGEKHLYKMINENANAVIYISNSIREKYKPHLSCVQYVIYNDISPQFINPKRDGIYTHKKLHAAIIGSIQEGKGQLEAIKAFEILNKESIKMILHIAGRTSGNYYEKIKKYVEEKNISNFIKFDGFIRDTNEYRTHMDVGIVASSSEAFGRVTIEGMLSELLMVGADSAGTSELIRNHQNGILYKLHDPEDLAKQLEWICSNTFSAAKIAKQGFEYAVEEFTTGKAAKKINNILIKIGKRG